MEKAFIVAVSVTASVLAAMRGANGVIAQSPHDEHDAILSCRSRGAVIRLERRDILHIGPKFWSVGATRHARSGHDPST
jgi:hypothetical protein